MEHLLANLILHHPRNLVRVLAVHTGLFFLCGIDLFSRSAVNDRHILRLQSRNAGSHQQLNCLCLFQTGGSAVLHRHHNVGRSLVKSFLCQDIFTLLSQCNGYFGILNPVYDPDGSCNPVLQIVQCIPVFVRIRSHQARILGVYLVAEAALGISLEGQACPCLVQNIFRHPDHALLGILVINLHFLELTHNFLGFFRIQAGKQFRITTVSVQKQGYCNSKNNQARKTGQYNLFCPALQLRNNRL